MSLPFGCVVTQDSDGDWVIQPPDDVTIFSVPGECVLLSAETEHEAVIEAHEYLRALKGDDANG